MVAGGKEADMVQSGQRGRFSWLVAPSELPSLVAATVRFHPRSRLCITAFDSGPFHPSPEQEASGWVTRGSVMVSPPLDEGFDISLDQYDEWYLLDEPPPHAWRPEVFVNYSGFTLVAIEEVYKTYGPTWDRYGLALDDLVPMQQRFWAQMEQVDPISYIAVGDQDVVVSKRPAFIEQLRTGA
jgi:hypothetical protein